ncbi:RNA-binding KH domain-containing protein RCF3 isoform X2 [Magnolia sinica]|uniref:RNA-binding KH domain-containing protein RCF3 isoform X2 n=1 Tax=Magnolia sinica TaxID=86752 RepID=UPI002657C98E|nr:RNA-binding KH domain-containing protein RCF3 isoform X2 [Magnolia sinica]
MERSRSKRSYYYDQDYDNQTPPRTKPRYHHNHHNNNNSHNHRRGGGRPSKPQQDGPPPPSVFFRILCPDVKAGGVIGKSGSIIKTIRQETGAWINVHPLISGDEERIIEISDARRRDPSYSPAQEALLMIHERILESESSFGAGSDGGDGDDEDDYAGPRGSGGRVTTRLVVPRANVGCLLGKGGKIIEQMRIETKTQIRILPRDHNLPNCVSMSEEIVQVVGDGNAVKKALAIISSRLKESLLRDRSSFRGRFHSPERYFPPDDDFTHTSNIRSSLDGPASGMALNSVRGNAYASRPSGYAFESAAMPMTGHAQSFHREDIVFRILCPNDKVESVMGESDGIIEMLRGDIGVDVMVTAPVPGSDEQIIIVYSDEGPDDELFPAQEALLHIQSRIVDLGPDKDNIITTRLLIPATDIGCLEGRDGSLSEMRRLTRANIQILPREDLPQCASGDELVQIVGDIRAARDALVQITLRLRSHLYNEISFPKDLLPPPPPPPAAAAGPVGNIFGLEAGSPNKNSACEGYQGSESSTAGYQNTQPATTTFQSKDTGRPGGGSLQQEESDANEEGSSGPSRSLTPVVTKKTLEVIIPEHAVPSLIMRSGSKLAQISEMSGATVSLMEDRPELTEKVVQISGSPEQAERAQSLLQGFILSTQDATPS